MATVAAWAGPGTGLGFSRNGRSDSERVAAAVACVEGLVGGRRMCYYLGQEEREPALQERRGRLHREKLRRLEEVFPVLVTCVVTEPDAEDYVRQKGIALYCSYDF